MSCDRKLGVTCFKEILMGVQEIAIPYINATHSIINKADSIPKEPHLGGNDMYCQEATRI